ncbi:MAG: hypothetical protein WD341_01795 [Tistlia sp.]|uniref:hypothetical protein n=1 Tax=Tistlia sp. TaxID=3057121 RepID=UPI0034A0D1B0
MAYRTNNPDSLEEATGSALEGVRALQLMWQDLAVNRSNMERSEIAAREHAVYVLLDALEANVTDAKRMTAALVGQGIELDRRTLLKSRPQAVDAG